MTKVTVTPVERHGSNHIIYEGQGCKAYYTAAMRSFQRTFRALPTRLADGYICLGSVDISDNSPNVMPECLNRASTNFEKAGFPPDLSPRRRGNMRE